MVVEGKLSQPCCEQSPVLDFSSLGLPLIRILSRGSRDPRDVSLSLGRESPEQCRTSPSIPGGCRDLAPSPPPLKAKPTGFLKPPELPGVPGPPMSPPAQPCHCPHPPGTALQPRLLLLPSWIDGGALQSRGKKKKSSKGALGGGSHPISPLAGDRCVSSASWSLFNF